MDGCDLVTLGKIGLAAYILREFERTLLFWGIEQFVGGAVGMAMDSNAEGIFQSDTVCVRNHRQRTGNTCSQNNC